MRKPILWALAMCCGGLFLVSCSDNAEFEKALVPSDPSKAVTFTSFDPADNSQVHEH